MAFSFMDWGVPLSAPYIPLPIIHSPPPLVELKTNKVMAEKFYPVTRSEMAQIHDVACTEWKEKIRMMMVELGMLFDSVGTIPEWFVVEMFDAADESQKKILREVFPTFRRTPKNLLEGISRDDMYKYVRQFSTEMFGSNMHCQVASSWAEEIDHPELKWKSIGFSKNLMDVIVHENENAVVLEFREKK